MQLSVATHFYIITRNLDDFCNKYVIKYGYWKFDLQEIPTIINMNKLTKFRYYKYNSVVIRL